MPPSNFDSIPLFAGLSETARRELADQAMEVHIQKGQAIFREGDPADWFHIVKHGSVKCVKSSQEGRDITLKILMPGDLFCCEASAFAGKSPEYGFSQLFPILISKPPNTSSWQPDDFPFISGIFLSFNDLYHCFWPGFL